MGEIRSAIDIAMEKTAHIEGDKSSAENRELKNAGKRAAGDFLGTGDTDALAKALKGKKAEQIKLVQEGIISILLASLRLPVVEEDLGKIERIGSGLDAILPDMGLSQLFGQVGQILHTYLSERDQLKGALEQQFLPKLRAKQQELSRRYGQNIALEPTQDPEYMAALSKNTRMLEQKYDTILEEVRSRVREVSGISE